MAKPKQKRSVRHHLRNWFVPHSGNSHKPHLLRTTGLVVCALVVLAIQVTGNYAKADKLQVLSYATAISVGEVISLTNQQRASSGLPALTTNAALNAAASAKAADMFANNYWDHVSPTGVQPWYWFSQAGYNYAYAGENLAKGFNTSAGVVNGWMASPGHRDNILNANYSNIGVAAVNGTLLGEQTTLVVAMYGAPAAAAAPAAPAPAAPPAPATAAEAPAPAPEPAPTEPVPEPEPTQSVPTVSLVSSGQTLSKVNAEETDYGLLRPLMLSGTVDWQRLLTIGVLGTILLVSVLHHTVVWRRSKRTERDIWFRTKPALQFSLLIGAILFVLVGSFGAVL